MAAILFGAATLTGCKKANPNNGNSSNNQWVAETLTFKVNDSSDGFIMKKVEGGDYSMEYMYENQVATVTGTLSDFYICPVDQRYGSLPGYIENQLGFKKEEQQQLRLKYLTTKQD